jgi:hypothetical protein
MNTGQYTSWSETLLSEGEINQEVIHSFTIEK